MQAATVTSITCTGLDHGEPGDLVAITLNLQARPPPGSAAFADFAVIFYLQAPGKKIDAISTTVQSGVQEPEPTSQN
jgi:hypothetical protein